ncbi:Ankyrin repeat-containing domain protein, partial [Metarhizium hybridum]
MAYKNPTADIDNLAQQLLRDVSSAMTDDADPGSKSDSDFESDSPRDSNSSLLHPTLVFAAHDIGGTVLKRLFFGTAHRASYALPWGHTLSRMLRMCFTRKSGFWALDFVRQLSTLHEKLAEDFGSIGGQFQIVNIFQNKSQSANYETIVDKFAATLERDNEIQIGLDASFTMMDDACVPELRKWKDYVTGMRLLSRGDLETGNRPNSKPIYRHLCDWILSKPVLKDWVNSTTQHLQVLTVNPTGDPTSFLSSIIASIQDMRKNQTDIFITASYDQLGKGTYKRAKLLASLVSQILHRCPRLFLEITNYQYELRSAICRSNIVWIEWLLWKSLETLLCCSAPSQIFCIIHQSQQPKSLDCYESFIADLAALSELKEVPSKILIIGNAVSDTIPEKTTSHAEVNLGEAEARAELRKDLERQLDLVGAGNRGSFPLRSTFLDHIFMEPIDLRRTRYFLRYIEHLPILTEAAVKEALHQFSTDNSAFSAILELVPQSSRLLVKDALSWIVHSMRPLTCDELRVALSIPGCDDDDGDSRKTGRVSPDAAAGLENILCGVVEIDNNTIYLTHENFGAFLDHPQPEMSWCKMGHTAHSDIARRCLTYLSHHLGAHPHGQETSSNTVGAKSAMETQKCPCWCNFGGVTGEIPFLEYTTQNWHKHLQLDPLEMDEQVRIFLDVDQQWENWATSLLRHRGVANDSFRANRVCAPTNFHGMLGTPLAQAVDIAIRAISLPHFEQTTEWSLVFLAVVQAGDISTMLNVHEVMNEPSKESTLMEAFATGSDDTLCELCKLQPDFVRARFDIILSHAAKLGNKRLMEFLLGEKTHSWPGHVDTSGLTPLYEAVKWGHTTMSKRLYDLYRSSPNFQLTEPGQDQPIIHVAARHGDSGLVAMICTAGMDINGLDSANMSPLYLAARHGHVDAVNRLLSAQANTDSADLNGDTALHAASRRGFCQIASALIRYGANVNMANIERETALHVAIDSGHENIALCLLGLDENTADDQNDQTLCGGKGNAPPEEYASNAARSEDGASKSVDGDPVTLPAATTSTIFGETSLGLEETSMARPSTNGSNTPCRSRVTMDVNIEPPLLLLAARGNHLKIIDALLKCKVPCDSRDELGRSALHIAAEYGNYEVFRQLVENGADVNLTAQHHTSVLHEASGRGHTDIVEGLLDKGADAGLEHITRVTALYFACKGGYIETVQALLPRYTRYDREEALRVAAIFGWVDILVLLLDSGTDKDAKDGELNSALHFAAAFDYPRVAEVLLRRRARFDMKNAYGETPLHRAARKNSLGVMELLIYAGADMNLRDNMGNTALFLAAAKDCPEAVRLLLENGAGLMIPRAPEYNDYDNMLDLSLDEFSLNVTKLILDRYMELNYRISDLVSSEMLQCLSTESGKDLAKIRIILDSNLDPNKVIGDIGTILHYAAFHGSLDVVQLLLEFADRLDLDIIAGEYGTALQTAACSGTRHAPEIIRLLLENQANPRIVGGPFGTALQAAATASNFHGKDSNTIALNIARLLLPHDVVNLVGGKHGTALQAAACDGSIEFAKLLLKEGAETHTVCGLYGTALHAAVSKSASLEMVNLILEQTNLRPDQQDIEGRLPLHLAAAHCTPELVKLLTKGEANVRSVDKFGRNALHFAAGSGSMSVVKMILGSHPDLIHVPDNDVSFLLQQGADSLTRTKSHWTPWHVATYHGKSLAAEQLTKPRSNAKYNYTIKGRVPRELTGLPEAAARLTVSSCDSCFCRILGKLYKCNECIDTRYCFKCYEGMGTDMHYPEHKLEEVKDI